MKTFLGFTTGLLAGFIATCALVVDWAVSDPEEFKNFWLNE